MADGGGLTDVSSNGTTDSWALRLLQEGRSSTSELDRTVVFERLLEAAVSERTGWACELYDETLLGYAGLQELLMGALREGESDKTQAALQAAIVDIDRGMRKLRTILTTLRPAALDEIGLPAALESLIDRHRDRGSAQIESMLAIVRPADRAARLAPELENLVYRLVEEGLTNIEQHANAENVRVTVSESETKMDIRVSDDGSGFDPACMSDPACSSQGFGLRSLQESVDVLGGVLLVASDERGTVLKASLPLAWHRWQQLYAL